ncbi:hypothetical protein GDI3525 [Gluconacetobacter diazotrophicus PA1 5]|uniref:Uncharacterized protein n=1 Tax=Gluconacetobacter diazotrophicus (strain ATCC 49037 / DSM 5601 / CCUG 37298 / CIP 103539 / LMG 7603 / PAl5) TaxID=272568 RepID=A9H4Q5_GLUDA|nr:hypothetical protein GDI3525 [Gluconacetobacter diazotrophicus PA1 5]
MRHPQWPSGGFHVPCHFPSADCARRLGGIRVVRGAGRGAAGRVVTAGNDVAESDPAHDLEPRYPVDRPDRPDRRPGGGAPIGKTAHRAEHAARAGLAYAGVPDAAVVPHRETEEDAPSRHRCHDPAQRPVFAGLS